MLQKEAIELLRQSFPKESVQIYRKLKGRKNAATGKTEEFILTGIKPQYIIERLNDVFGHDCWDFKILKFDRIDNFAWVLGELSIFTLDRNDIGSLQRIQIATKQQFGTSELSEQMGWGDCFKAAATNALDKCASNLDIAHEAYKGLVPPPTKNGTVETEEDTKLELNKLCKENGINKTNFAKFTKNVLSEEIEPKDLTEEQVTKLVAHLKKNGAPF